MKIRLSNEQVREYTKAAMAPLRCVAELCDAGNRYGFAVYFEHRERVVVRDLLTRQMEKPQELERYLMHVRSQLLSEGEKLNDWQGIPPQADC